MELLTGLGVNSTVGLQFAIFLISYLVLYFVLFKPYFRIYTERVERTMGRTELAERFISEAHELQQSYETKARELSNQYKSIYDQSRAAAMHEYDKLVSDARASAKGTVEAAKEKIAKEMTKAEAELQKEIPTVATTITTQLLGKEMSL